MATESGPSALSQADVGAQATRSRSRYLRCKRAVDLILATVLLAGLAPAMLLIALAIRLDSPGPALHVQQRVGVGGRVFGMFKFRSMRAGADTAPHRAYVARLITENLAPEPSGPSRQPSLKLQCDSRITRVGRWIRRTSLDEVPQLLNVIAGDMSLVGPRPPLAYEVQYYQPWHRRRLEVIPGVTGLWQVKGRNQVTFDEMVLMDLDYIERRSLRLDLAIMLQTPAAMIAGRGAG